MKNYFNSYLKIITICYSMLFVVSCKEDVFKSVEGKWYAAQLVECDEIIPIEREHVNLELLPEGKYVFNSTLNIREEGNYHIKDSLLYTKDLLKPDANIKIVKITKFNQDTLELAMNYKGKDQILSLLREKTTLEGQTKTVKETSVATADSVAAESSKDTTNNNNTAIAAAATTALAATALAATTPQKEVEKKETKKETKKESTKKETKKSKKEIEREKREKEEERKDREKERKKRENAKKAREKREKEEEQKDRERERKKRENAKKKKKK